MVLKGKVVQFNGKFGVIIAGEDSVDFVYTDISLNQQINVGDTVEFRVEENDFGIMIARNITKVEVDNNNEI